MDVLSDMLRLVRLRGALFLHGEFHEPWCINAPRGGEFADMLCPGAAHLAILHLVLEGRCWIVLHGAEPMAVHAGEAVVLPHGDAHLVGSSIGQGPPDLRDVVRVRLPEVALVRYGGEGERCVMVCGWFAYERERPHPFLASLPRAYRADLGGGAGAWIGQSLRHALRDEAAHEPGSSAMAARMAESLFLESVRSYSDALPSRQGGWLAGLRDPQVGRCLALLHEQPAHAWSVEELARAVHLSRSVLAERFSALVGVPPMQYLKRLRLALAARMLGTGEGKLLRVAEAVGYESDASFSRAFKLQYGVTPGQWRTTGDAEEAGRA